MRKILSVILSCLLVFGISCTAFTNVAAATYFTYNGYEYLVTTEGDAIICEYSGTKTDIVIPEAILGHNVISIDSSAFSYNSKLISVSFTKAIHLKNIGRGAFQGCSSLKSIVLTPSITSIGQSAFQGCTSLESLDLGGTITTIPAQAFYECTALTEIEIPDNISSIGYYAFGKCTALKKAYISYMITQISDSFYGCTNLTVFGFKDTSAQEYAEANNIPFVCLNGDKDFDVNGDSFVDILDVTIMQKYIVELIVYDKDDYVLFEKLDANSDGEFNVRDVTFLQRLLVGL